MNQQVVVQKKRNKNLSSPRGAGRAKKSRSSYSPAHKLKAVRLRLEEGFSIEDVCAEMGMVSSCLSRWVNLYRQFGEAGLQPAKAAKRRSKLPEPIAEKILELKRQQPQSGIKKISQWLHRWFFLPASPETVRRHLHAADLMPEAPPPKRRNLTRPRFFERATPNQMWQSD